MIDRNIKEPLDLRLVQIHCQHAVGAGRAEHIRHELRRNRDARLVLPILSRVAEVRHDGGDSCGRRSFERVDHDQHLHDVLIDRRGSVGAGRLHHEDVGAADVLVDLKRDFRIGEALEPCLPHRHAQKRRNFARQFRMRAARKQLQLAEPHGHARITRHTGSLSKWLGRKDSNLRIRDPKSRALPLRHAPTSCATGGMTSGAASTT